MSSKVSSNAARFNRIKSRRIVRPAEMRVLRAEMAARRALAVAASKD
jgi:hypothetical protein